MQKRDAAIKAAHAKKSAAIEARDTDVCSLFDQKTDQLAAKETAARTAAANASTAAAAAASSPSAAEAASANASAKTDLALQKALLDLEDSRKQQEELLQKIRSMQTETAAAAAGAAAVQPPSPDSPPGTVVPFTPLGVQAPATPMIAASDRFLALTAAVNAESLPQPIPDNGLVSNEIKDTINHMEQFYAANAFNAIPPTTPLELHADMDTLYAMLGEQVWAAFYGDIVPAVDDALPTQMHTVLTHQVRLASGMIKERGDKGAGKGKGTPAGNPYY